MPLPLPLRALSTFARRRCRIWFTEPGTVWIAASLKARSEARRFLFRGDRSAIRDAAVEAGLEMLDELLEVD